MSKPQAEPRFVVCIQNGEYRASLEVRKLYQVVADPDAAALGQLRVIDESGPSLPSSGETVILV